MARGSDSGVEGAVILSVLFFAASLVPGTASTYTQGPYTWAGNPYCVEFGFVLQSTSPAIDQGELIAGFHCPAAGSALSQARQADGSYCVEWYGKAPDIGACEFVPEAPPAAPSDLQVTPPNNLVV